MLKVIAIVLALGLSADVLAQEGERHNEDESFVIGGSCAALAYMSSKELKELLGGAFPDELRSFCYPEEPSSCSDYSSFLKGMGRLGTSDDGYHCSLQMTL